MKLILEENSIFGHDAHELIDDEAEPLFVFYKTSERGTEDLMRRMVACVNICEGIETAFIEQHLNLLDAEADAVLKIAAQRDALLVALNGMLREFNEQMPGIVNDELAVIARARAAIAKATGNA